MRIPTGKADAFIKQPDPNVLLVLVYGPDAGLVRERADALTRQVVEDPKDPFRIVHIGDKDLADDPARLSDEAAAIAFGGGRRVVRVAPAKDAHADTVKSFLAAPMGDALVILEAESLNARSSLRKTVEAARNAAAVPCYADEGAQLGEVVRDTLARHGLEADRAAVAYLSDNLGGDRGLTRRELEKLALFALPPDGGERGPVTLEEAAASVGDTSALTLDDLSAAVGDGDLARVDRCYRRAVEEGIAPVRVLRAVSRHVQTVMAFAALTAKGKSSAEAGRSLRPPAFGPRVEIYRRQQKLCDSRKLARMLQILNEAEIRCKSTGVPDIAMCGEALIRLAQLARGRGQAARRLA